MPPPKVQKRTAATPVAPDSTGTDRQQEEVASMKSKCFLSPADEQWIDEHKARLPPILQLYAPGDNSEWRKFLSEKMTELKKLSTTVRNRKRTCERRTSEPCDSAIELLTSLEDAVNSSIKLVRMVGSATFSGDEAIEIFEALDSCLCIKIHWFKD